MRLGQGVETAQVRATSPSPRRRFAVPAIATGSCLLAVSVFGVGARDDDYITYWAAEQLAKTGRLVNLNGSHVEQSSSLAHVVLLAVLYFVTRAPLPCPRLHGRAREPRRDGRARARIAAHVEPGAEVATALVVAVSFPLVFWSTGGLETALAAASVLWFAVQLDRLLDPRRELTLRRVATYVASALLIVTVRPDTMFVAIVVVILVLAVATVQSYGGPLAARALPKIDRRRAASAALGVLGAAGVLALFRLAVFHSALPQPELAKAGGLGWLPTGFSYVFSSLPYWMWLPYLALFAIGVVWCLRSKAILGLLVAALFGSGAVAIMFTRGDWMGGARLLVPYLAAGLVTMVLGAWSLRNRWHQVALATLVLVECVSFVLFADGTTWLSSSYTSQTANPADVIAADLGSPFGASIRSSTGPVPPLPWYTAWDFIHARDSIFLSATTPLFEELSASTPARARSPLRAIRQDSSRTPGRTTSRTPSGSSTRTTS